MALASTVTTPVPESSTTRSALRRIRPSGWGGPSAAQLFLVPIAVVFVVLFVIPLGQTLYWSFTDFTGFVVRRRLRRAGRTTPSSCATPPCWRG